MFRVHLDNFTNWYVVGASKVNFHGALGAESFVNVVQMHTLVEAIEFVKSENCTVYGVLPKKEAVAIGTSVHRMIFKGNVAFVLDGVETTKVDDFVYVDSVGDMERTIETSIVLHHFASQAKYEERGFQVGRTMGKYIVADRVVFDEHEKLTEEQLQVRALRAARKESVVEVATSFMFE